MGLCLSFFVFVSLPEVIAGIVAVSVIINFLDTVIGKGTNFGIDLRNYSKTFC